MQFSDSRLEKSRDIPGNDPSTGWPPCHFGVVARAVVDEDKVLELKLVSKDGNPVCYTHLTEDEDGDGTCDAIQRSNVTTIPRTMQGGGPVVDQQAGRGHGSEPTGVASPDDAASGDGMEDDDGSAEVRLDVEDTSGAGEADPGREEGDEVPPGPAPERDESGPEVPVPSS